MRIMQKLRILTFTFFIAYTAIQALGKVNASKFEYFPVFSWSLFSAVRNDIVSYSVEITSVDGKLLETPRNFYDMPELSPFAARKSSELYKSTLELIILRTDPTALAVRQDSFAQQFFQNARTVEYQVVLERFNPLVRLKTGEVTKRTVVLTGQKRAQ